MVIVLHPTPPSYHDAELLFLPDLQGYLLQRIQGSAEIQSNVSLNGRLDNAAFAKLSTHLKALSRGSYLYLKLTLDLIEKGYLVLKSSSFKVSLCLSPGAIYCMSLKVFACVPYSACLSVYLSL